MPYKTIEEAKEKGFKTVIDGKDLNIAQVNHIAEMYDKIKEDDEIENPMAVAISAFKKAYKIEGDKWSRQSAALSEKKMEKLINNEIMLSTQVFSVEKEILRTGTWIASKGEKVVIEEKDLDNIKHAFEAGVYPDGVALRVGAHQEFEKTAGGWVEGLKRVGNKLFATIANIPLRIKDSIENKEYKTVSSGLRKNVTDNNNKVWPIALEHVALLGSIRPAVAGMEGFGSFFNGYNGEMIMFSEDTEGIYQEEIREAEKEEKIMDEKILQLNEKLKDQVIGLSEQIKESDKTIAQKDIELSEAKKEIEAMKADSAKKESERKVTEIETFLSSESIVKRVMPHQKEDYKVILMNAVDLSAKMKEVAAMPEVLKFEEKSSEGGAEKVNFEKQKAATEQDMSMNEGQNIELQGYDTSVQAQKMAAEYRKADPKLSSYDALAKAYAEIGGR